MTDRKRPLMTSAALWLAFLLSSCGGESVDTPAPIVVNPSPTPAPAPAPAPAPTPTPTPPPPGTGSLASYSEGAVPGLAASDFVMDLKVTNRGVYFRAADGTDARPDRVIKLHGNPAGLNAWTTVTPDSRAGTLLFDFAPSNIVSEPDRAVSFYWASGVATVSDRWGHYTANTGGVSIEAEEPFVIPRTFGQIDRVAAGAVNGIVAQRPWIVEDYPYAGKGYLIYQDDGAYTKQNTITDRFSKAATPDLAVQPSVIVSHPIDPHLYVASGDRLYVYDADRQIRTYTFPSSLTGFTDLIWYQGDLYAGHGDSVYRLRAGQAAFEVLASSSLPAFGLPGRFCVASGEIFVATGHAINIQSRARRDWVARGTLTQAQTVNETIIRGALAASGVHCSAGAVSPLIYSYSSIRRTMLAITPLSAN
jgi:hypothetical protein